MLHAAYYSNFTRNTSAQPLNNDTFKLEDLITNYFKHEEIEGFKCSFCKRSVTVVKRQRIMKFPPVLLLFIKRFTIEYEAVSKLETKIRVRDFLVIEPKLSWNAADNTQYNLAAMVNHYGSLYSGHYTW